MASPQESARAELLKLSALLAEKPESDDLLVVYEQFRIAVTEYLEAEGPRVRPKPPVSTPRANLRLVVSR